MNSVDRVKGVKQHNDDRYRALFDRAPDAIVVLDVETGLFVEANPQSEKLFNRSVEDLVGKVGPAHFSPQVQPDGGNSSELTQHLAAEALLGGFPIFPWTFVVDGREVPCEVSVAHLPDPERKLVRGSIIDLTEHKQREARYRALFDHTPDAILIFDVERGVFSEANQRAAEMFGISISDFMNGSFGPADMVAPNQPDGKPALETIAHYNQLALETGFASTSAVFLAKGREMPAIVRLRPLPEAGTTMLLVSISDESERELEAQRYRALFDLATDAIMTVDMETLRFVEVNPKTADFFGVSAASLTDGSYGPLEVSPEFQPDGRLSAEIAAGHIEELRRGGRPVFEWYFQRPDGELVLGETHLTIFPDKRGELLRASVIDLSKKQQSEDRYRSIFEHATEAILIQDMDLGGAFIDGNSRAEALFDTALAELTNGQASPLDYSPEFQPDGRTSLQAAMSYAEEAIAGDFPSFEWTFLIDDVEVVCDVTLSRFPDTERNLIRGSMHDITARKQAEKERLALQEQLVQAQKLEAVGQMTGGVAHDFNNLLGVILGNLELLSDTATTEEMALIKDAMDATIQGADLSRGMLTFARRANLEPKEMDLSETVCNVQRWMARTLPATIQTQLALMPNPWRIMADRSGAESALLNLVINARDAMPDGGILTIETQNAEFDTLDHAASHDLQPGRYVILSVSDTGSGIKPELLERVFEPFFSTKDATNNSGLGLSIVHGFMKQSGGTARIYSEVGQGTSIKLFFPASTNAANVAPQEADATDVGNRQHVRVLVAEDQLAVARILETILTQAGHSVTTASNGDEAFRLFNADSSFDLLLTDIVMPGTLQGPGLAKALRELRPNLPVIFMSGYAKEAMRYGNGLKEEDIRLTKPVARAKLLRAIEDVLTT